jgi:hypothetical protein
MKLVLQIALGVFLGCVPALFMLETWWSYKQEQSKAETTNLLDKMEQNRLEQAEKLRAILNQNHSINPSLIMPNEALKPDTDQTSQIPGK